MAKKPISRIDILDHKKLGKKICEWSLKPSTRPTSIEAMKKELKGIAKFPARIKGVSWVESDLATFVVRVPNEAMVKESIEYMKKHNTGPYPFDMYYYAEKICEPDSSVTNLDFLYTRIADYTIAQCK